MGRKRKRTPAKSQSEAEVGPEVEQAVESVVNEDDAVQEAADEDSDGEMKEHLEELQRMKETDPEFFNQLESEAPDLLHQEPEEPMEVVANDGVASKGEVLTMETVDDLIEAMAKSVRRKELDTLSHIVTATARMLGVKEDDDEETDAQVKYRIEDQIVFGRIIGDLIPDLGRLMDTALGNKNHGNPRKCTLWGTLGRVIRIIVENFVGILGKSSAKESFKEILAKFEDIKPYLYISVTLYKRAIKALIEIWLCEDIETSNYAFRMILKLATTGEYLNIALKNVYISHIAKGTPITHELQSLIANRRNIMIDLFKKDATVAYQHCFVYIRQIAIVLKEIDSTNTKQLGTILNWRFYESLLVLVEVVCRLRHNKEISLLVYPLTQVILGLADRLKAGPYIPFRLNMFGLLIRLARERKVYIPFFVPLIEVFVANASKYKRTAKLGKTIDFEFTIKLAKSAVTDFLSQESIHKRIFVLLREGFEVFAAVPAFPELLFPIVNILKRELKSNNKYPLAKEVSKLMADLRENSEWAAEVRKKISVSPAEYKEFDMLALSDTEPPLLRNKKHEKAPDTAMPVEKDEDIRESPAIEVKEEEKRPKKKRKRQNRRKRDEDIVVDMKLE